MLLGIDPGFGVEVPWAGALRLHAPVAVGLSLAILIGVVVSLRREGVAAADSPAQIEVFPVT